MKSMKSFLRIESLKSLKCGFLNVHVKLVLILLGRLWNKIIEMDEIKFSSLYITYDFCSYNNLEL